MVTARREIWKQRGVKYGNSKAGNMETARSTTDSKREENEVARTDILRADLPAMAAVSLG